MTIMGSIENFLLAEFAADLGTKSFDPDEDLLEQNY